MTMIGTFEVLNRDLPSRLGRLAADPVTLVCLLLAADALANPYRGLYHDSCLYGVQVMERIHPGSFAGDLYLRYGSQDRYSLFTPLVAPLVHLFGLHAAFFCVYLASKAMLFWGLVRLIRVLISNNVALILALIHLAIVPVAFGGNDIFHVNESFLTPRLASCAFVLLAMERMLAGRMVIALGLLLGSLLLHPLMAVGGIVPVGLWWGARYCTRRQLAWLSLSAVAFAALVIGIEPLGNRLFGHMDEVWRTINFEICAFICPALWEWDDWVRIGLECAFVVWAACQCPDRRLAMFWSAVLGSAVIGLIGSLIAVNSNYLLLIQASPYRTLWLLELLAIPAGYEMAAQLWRCGGHRPRAGSLVVVLLLTLNWNCDLWKSAGLIALALLGLAAIYRGFAQVPRTSDWLWRSTRSVFLATIGCMLLYNILDVCDQFRIKPSFELEILPASMNASLSLFKLPLVLLIIIAYLLALRITGKGFTLRLPLLVFCAGYQALLLWAPSSCWYATRFEVRDAHVRFVDSSLSHRVVGRGKPLTIFWPTRVDDIWFRTGNHSYFDFAQMSGCAFNRGTAVEGSRRYSLVLPFELEKLNLFQIGKGRKAAPVEGQKPEGLVRSPGKEELLRLCRESNLDFIVLKRAIKQLYFASDGYYYLYDCEQLRKQLSDDGLHIRNRSHVEPANHPDASRKSRSRSLRADWAEEQDSIVQDESASQSGITTSRNRAELDGTEPRGAIGIP